MFGKAIAQQPFLAAAEQRKAAPPRLQSVETFGSATVKAIIDYKWKRFARRRIYSKSLVYLIYVLLFTAFAVVIADDKPFLAFNDLLGYAKGRSIVALACILFLFGFYYMAQELFQLYKLGASAYFDSFWNLLDLASYGATLVIMPCVLARYGVAQGLFVPGLVAIEVILLWIKQMFFALAIDGLGTFIYMTIEIIKGMRYFLLLLLMLFVSFGVAFMVLFRGPGLAAYLPPEQDPLLAGNTPSLPGAVTAPPPPPAGSAAPAAPASDGAVMLFNHYGDFGSALLSAFLVMFGNEDPRNALQTDWPQVATVLLCLYNFTLIVVLLNMLITLMGEVYKKVVRKEGFVFLQGRAELIIEVESTMDQSQAVFQAPPYLHILRPVAKQARSDAADTSGDSSSKVEEMLLQLLAASGAPGGAAREAAALGAEEPEGDNESDDDKGGDGKGGERSFKTAHTMRQSLRSAPMTGLQSAGKQISDATSSSHDAEAVMRELGTLRRLMEGMALRMKVLEANSSWAHPAPPGARLGRPTPPHAPTLPPSSPTGPAPSALDLLRLLKEDLTPLQLAPGAGPAQGHARGAARAAAGPQPGPGAAGGRIVMGCQASRPGQWEGSPVAAPDLAGVAG
ncbi:hypothetical protein QJQ45_027354 [Haematococcus lacustris]|nr:hypothetical protein QJQ45_027354 [Haematococcus lacustris]